MYTLTSKTQYDLFWHITDEENVNSILKHGLTYDPNRGSYYEGDYIPWIQGTYLSKSLNYVWDEIGGKCIVLVQVNTGNKRVLIDEDTINQDFFAPIRGYENRDDTGDKKFPIRKRLEIFMDSMNKYFTNPQAVKRWYNKNSQLVNKYLALTKINIGPFRGQIKETTKELMVSLNKLANYLSDNTKYPNIAFDKPRIGFKGPTRILAIFIMPEENEWYHNKRGTPIVCIPTNKLPENVLCYNKDSDSSVPFIQKYGDLSHAKYFCKQLLYENRFLDEEDYPGLKSISIYPCVLRKG